MIRLRAKKLLGELEVIPSKSELHRILFISVLRNKYLKINNVVYSNDILASINALKNINANIVCHDNYLEVFPSKLKYINEINVLESGTTLRFIIPLLLALDDDSLFIINGQNHLVNRPIDDYFSLFKQNNLSYEYDSSLPLKFSGKLTCNYAEISSKTSSQFISALLIVFAFRFKTSSIKITSKIESFPYINLTIKMLEIFNIKVSFKDNIFTISTSSFDEVLTYTTNADMSHAANFLVMNALGANIKIKNLKYNYQGDYKIIEFLEKSSVFFDDNYLVKQNNFQGLNLDLKDNPDLALVLAIYALFLEQPSHLKGLYRLKFKESNRLKAIIDIFDSLKVNYKVINEDELVINKLDKFTNIKINTYNDHRILFIAAVLSMFVDVYVDEIDAVNKSYPSFFEEYKRLGGNIYYE